MATTPSTGTHSTTRNRRRAATASFIGSTVEYYDFLLYTVAAALVFPAVFFSNLSSAAGVIVSFGTLAAGYFARPLGAIVCGHYGDRIGRKSMLIFTMSLMGVSSVIIGLIPSFDSIGTAAPILLVVARMAQGFATGGEWGGSVLVSTEAAPDKKGLFGGFTQVGGPVGGLLATAFMTVMTYLPEDQFLVWGWRVPFLASALLVGLGLLFRLRLAESSEFTEVQKGSRIHKFPLKSILKNHRRALLVAIMIAIGAQATVGIVSIYMLAYADGIGFDKSTTLNTKMLMNFGNIAGVMFFAWLSDYVGKRRLVVVGGLVLVASAFPLFALVNTLNAAAYMLAMVTMYTLVQPMIHGPSAGLLSELFPTDVRYSGTSLGYQVGSVLGAGLAPLIASSLLASAGGGMNSQFISIFMIVVGVIAVSGALISRAITAESQPVEQEDPAANTRLGV